jgi:hypothetical protein
MSNLELKDRHRQQRRPIVGHSTPGMCFQIKATHLRRRCVAFIFDDRNNSRKSVKSRLF